MKNSKKKKKIWSTSLSLFAIYLTILIVNPNIWLILLPIIIPTGALTIGIPGYAIIKNSKDSLEKKAKEQELSLKEDKENNCEIEKTKVNTIKTENNEIENILDIQNEKIEIKQEKPKIKTKGTIH